MKKKILISISFLLFLLLLSYIIINIRFINKLEDSTNNTIKKINSNIYSYELSLNISYNKGESEINNKIIYIENSNKDIKKYITKIIDNDTTTEELTSYTMKEENFYYYYTYKNKWTREKIEKLDDIRTFKINYSKFFNNLKNIKKEKETNKYIIYSASIENYKAYNFIYSDEILNKKDIKGKTKVYIKVNKDDSLVSSVKYKINGIKKDDINASYEVILKNNYNLIDIKLPF